MIKKIIFGAFLCTLISVVYSCKEIIEEDISDSPVILLAPGDSITLSNLMVTFWWEEVDEALAYRLQVVSPNFNNIHTLILDTLVKGNQFSYSLNPGQYQWRVRAENGSSQTAYSYRTFSIDSLIDLGNQTVVLKSPTNNLFTNRSLHTFKWVAISVADHYRFEILDSTGTTIEQQSGLQSDTVMFDFTSDGKYKWRVQAQNNAGQSTAYSTRDIIIDKVAPNSVLLLLPRNDSVFSSNNVTMQWQRGAATGVVTNIISDSLYIYSDVTMLNKVRSIKTTSTQYSDTLSSGSYYWRIFSMDEAGNKSNFSTVRRFIIP